jgi:ribosomal-protein-alanine N-acetyltransferase
MDHGLVVPQLAAGDALLLRPWELGEADLTLVRETADDPYIQRVTSVPAYSAADDGAAFVRRQWERAADGSGYPFVIVRREDYRPVGTIGLWLKDIDNGRAWIGYWLVEHARGHGIAAAALRAITTWGLSELQIPRLQLCVEPWNTASIRTAERAGYRREGLLRQWQEIDGKRRDMLMYSMLRADLA